MSNFFYNTHAKHHYDPVEVVREAIRIKKRQFPFDAEVDEVKVNGEDITEELKE